MPSDAARTVHAVLCLATDLARSVDDLNDSLRANRPVIDRLKAAAPDLWDDLRQRTQAKRARLQEAAPLPSAPPPAPVKRPIGGMGGAQYRLKLR